MGAKQSAVRSGCRGKQKIVSFGNTRGYLWMGLETLERRCLAEQRKRKLH
jgi:hypothetical protein